MSGRVAIVTGASSVPGIGTACAARLASEGASLVVNARSEEPLNSFVESLRTSGAPAIAVAGSMLDPETPAKVVEAAVEAFGRVDCLVNTVGGTNYRGPALELTREGLMGTVDLNTWPTVALIEVAMRYGLSDGGGAVVNISSGSPKKATASMAAYAAGKAALNALTRTFANALAPVGVRVNAVCPGLTRTTYTAKAWEDDGGRGAGQNLPLGRITEPADVAAAVAFLLSDDAAAITGVLLDVDMGNHLTSGGWSPRAADSEGAPGHAGF